MVYIREYASICVVCVCVLCVCVYVFVCTRTEYLH